MSVMFEVRPGVYRKNVQIAHIYGVRPGAPRYMIGMPDSERDAFKHLLLLCLPHHAEVDDRRTGERLYPAEVLLEWKRKHEGDNNVALNRIGPVDEDAFMEYVAEIFEPPLKRLESIADRLEKTGTINADAVVELRGIVSALTDNPVGIDARSIRILTDAVGVLGGRSFPRTVAHFSEAANTMMKAVRRLPDR
ncbi:hypothetical protein ACPB67_16350 [Micromonospora taraxaci]|uniref:hypothetical protein n=1 Tax=Micromonospora taraxaci TaxID=1316803 RepID=UPI003C2D6BE7